ncbi:MAG: M23 family metallopeptidase [Alphaproteobacteria bacterium]|nr:M23 family metallopeptidase [Alphaproteobacteria bacterium]
MKSPIWIMLLILSSCASQEPAEIIYGTKIESQTLKTSSSKDIVTKIDELETNDSNNTDGHYLKIHEEPKRYIDEDYVPNDEKSNTESNFSSGTSSSLGSDIRNKSNDDRDSVEKLNSELASISQQQVHKQQAQKQQASNHEARESRNRNAGDAVSAGPYAKGKNSLESNSDKSPSGAGRLSDQEDLSGTQSKSHNSIAPNPISETGGFKISRPVEGSILNKYGESVNGTKLQGVDFSAKAGQPIKAAYSGVVVAVGRDAKFGFRVILKHEDIGIETAYAHLGKISVSKGQVIRRGEEIGFAQEGKASDIIIVHFAVRKGSKIMNPSLYLE